ncbi:MAG: DUF2961 domain-containing protein [Comamonadaceae bacterium]|nr:DUF2961 domain-containing protein [Comamonadaceae bacterium]
MAHALRPVLPDHGQERGGARRRRVLLLHRLPRAPGLPADTPYFHAQYRQEFPPAAGRNYLLLSAEGDGHFVGTNLSVLQRALGWWGEGDDMIRIDGESRPSLHGTGSEDYFSDAWGMREGQSLFYGCPLQEEDFQAGSKATRLPLPRPRSHPVPKIDRSDDRARPRERPRGLPVFGRLLVSDRAPSGIPGPPARRGEAPVRLRAAGELRPPGVGRSRAGPLRPLRRRRRRVEPERATPGRGPVLVLWRLGRALPFLRTDGAAAGAKAEFRFPVEVRDLYDIEVHFLKGPAAGSFRVLGTRLEGYAREPGLGSVVLAEPAPRAGFERARLRGRGQGRAERGERPLLRRLRPPARRAPVHRRMEPRRTVRGGRHGRPARRSIRPRRRRRRHEAMRARAASGSAGGPSRPTLRATSGSTVGSNPTKRPSSTPPPGSFRRTTGPRPCSSGATTASGSGSTARSSTPIRRTGPRSPTSTG